MENTDSNQWDQEKATGRGAAGGGRAGRACVASARGLCSAARDEGLYRLCVPCVPTCVWRVCCMRASFLSTPVEGLGRCWSPPA